MATKYKRLQISRMGTLLLRRGVIDPSQLEEALVRQRARGGRLGHLLAELGAAEDGVRLEEAIAQVLASQYGIPRLPLDAYQIDNQVLALVPERIASRHCLMPVERMGSNLAVTMADPLDAAAVQDVEALTRCSVQALLGTPSEIRKAIAVHYSSGAQRLPAGRLRARS